MLLLGPCTAFQMPGNCPATFPCSCTGTAVQASIICNNMRLIITPRFQITPKQSQELNVYLYANRLTTIPANAFKNLNSVNASSIHVNLNSNRISTMSLHAFDGIENAVTILQLRDNRLSIIPTAIGKLNALKYLDVSDNSLSSLGVSVMPGIGQSLQTLYIDLKNFLAWPNELSSLNTLQHLIIRSIPFAHISPLAFQGFEKSLITLTLNRATMQDVPYALCTLSNLKSLILEKFDHRTIGGNSNSLFTICKAPMKTVTSLSLHDSKLDVFPDVFRVFPTLVHLNLRRNSFEFIELEKVPANNVLTKLDLHSCKLRRVPSVVRTMKHLTDLDLSNNDITSVEDGDLTGLTGLQTLRLADSKLRYISNNAFVSNGKISTLDLGNTDLITIPFAVKSLTKLVDFDIRHGQQVQCTCAMSYLKGWDAFAVTNFKGQCASSLRNIQHYIMTTLQHCP